MTEFTRNEMIDDLVDAVDDWELETLIAYSKECLRDGLEILTDEELAEEHNDFINKQ
jgi:hypothetical protein